MIFYGHPTTHPLQNLGVATPNLLWIDTYDLMCDVPSSHLLFFICFVLLPFYALSYCSASSSMVLDKMAWTKWHGQNGTDKMARTKWHG